MKEQNEFNLLKYTFSSYPSLSIVVDGVACDSCAALLAASATGMSKLSKGVAAAANAEDDWAE